MIFMNISSYDEIWDYECMYKVGCLMWYLALNRVMGFYSLHCISITWVVYMLGWYHVGLAYDAHFMCILNLLGKKYVLTKMSFYGCFNGFYA